MRQQNYDQRQYISSGTWVKNLCSTLLRLFLALHITASWFERVSSSVQKNKCFWYVDDYSGKVYDALDWSLGLVFREEINDIQGRYKSDILALWKKKQQQATTTPGFDVGASVKGWGEGAPSGEWLYDLWFRCYDITILGEENSRFPRTRWTKQPM